METSIKYLLIQPEKTPEIKESNSMKEEIYIICGKNASILHTMPSEDGTLAVIGAPISEESNGKPCNRLLYFGLKSRSVGGIIDGDFIIVGIKKDFDSARIFSELSGDLLVSLTDKQIRECKLLYGKRSITDLHNAL